MRLASIVLFSALLPLAAHAEGDADAGKTAYSKCAICHSIKEGENKIGPSLYGVVGRASHSVPGYAYSEAMKKYDVTWNAETLDPYLADPRKAVPGTKMVFIGIKSGAERANVIAYLSTLK